MNRGRVTFVGAGPWDPGLLTVRGREALARAEVLVYDRGIHPSLLEEAPSDAERIPAGAESARLLLARARAGKETVRLQAGDGLLAGSLRREAEALAEASLPFEIVPGVPAAVALPVYAGIPLPEAGEWTLSGAEGESLLLSDVPPAETARRLMDEGWPSSAPAFLIVAGTRMEQRVAKRTLGEWAQRAADIRVPGSMFVLGTGAGSGSAIPWFESRPLFGRRVLVTRSLGQGGRLSRKIRELGGEAVEIPSIRLQPARDPRPLDGALHRLEAFDWVVFTSANGVNFFYRRLREQKRDIRRLQRAKVAAVGSMTAQALEEKGLTVDVVAGDYRAESLVEALSPLVRSGQEVLLPRSAIGRRLLTDQLEALGCRVTDAPAYETLPDSRGAEEAARLLREGSLHVLTFTSSSTVNNFVRALESVDRDWRSLLGGAKVACIGPVTADTAGKLGMHVDVTARPHTIDALAEAIARLPGES